MARLGLNVADVQDVIEVAIGGKAVGQVFEGDRRFDILVRLPEALRTDMEQMKRIPIPLPHGCPSHDVVTPCPLSPQVAASSRWGPWLTLRSRPGRIR